MQDPIGSFYAIRDNFITYVETAFRTRFPSIEQQRKALLETPGILYQRPWIEPMPRYKSGKRLLLDGETGNEGLALDDLKLDGKLPPGFDNEKIFEKFKKLARAGLMGDFPLHSHQEEMLRRGLHGENLVVTAGTGSGKTEAFLLPLLAQLVMESSKWNGVIAGQAVNWWNDETYKNSCRNNPNNPRSNFARSWFVPKRISNGNDGARGPAVRALVIYPMNALVEDQMTRLREALDSRDTRQWYNDELHAGGHGQAPECFYFGRYTGTTPIPGRERLTNPDGTDGGLDRTKIKELEKEFKAIDECSVAARQYDDQNGGTENVRFFFPSLDGAEMCSRWDMQEFPPDILVTNFSMLSVMMMRELDSSIFEKTRAWLEGDPWRKSKEGRPERVFHLIIDELHLYRGTAGTEVAYLIRLLLHRLGLEPNSKQLQILASSASLTEDEESQKFLEDFFGAKDKRAVRIIPGATPTITPVIASLPRDPFTKLSDAYDAAIDAKLDKFALDERLEDCYREIGQCLENDLELPKYQPDATSDLPNLGGALRQLSDVRFSDFLLQAFSINGEYRARDSLEVAKRIFAVDGVAEDEMENLLVRKALRGLLILRGRAEFAVRKDNQTRLVAKDTLPSLRMHWFFRNLDGLWASPGPTDIPAGMQNEGCPVGRVIETPETLTTESGNRLLELLYCERCGAVFLGGAKQERLNATNSCIGWELLPNDPDIEGIPDRRSAMLSQQKNYDEYGVFWPNGNLQPTRNLAWKADDRDAKWVQASLDPRKGHVQADAGLPITGYFYHFQNLDSTNNAVNTEIRRGKRKALKAFPAVCPCCGEDCTKRMRKKSPLRTFRTGFTKVSQVFAKELFYQLPSKAENDRKLVVFSDSREDAARIANDIERYHYSDMVRDALYSELRLALWGKASLASALLKGQPEADWDDLALLYRKRSPTESQILIDYATRWNEIYAGIQILPQATQDAIRAANSDYQALLSDSALINGRVIEIRKLFDERLRNQQPNLIPLFIQRMKNIGVNPAGVSPMLASFWEGAVKNEKSEKHWWEWFDFTPDACWKSNLPGAWTQAFRDSRTRTAWRLDRNTNKKKQVQLYSHNGHLKFIKEELAMALFGQLYFGFESSGLGYPCLPLADADYANIIAGGCLPNNLPLRDICNSVVRLLGEKYRYEQVDPEYPVNPVNEHIHQNGFKPSVVTAFVRAASKHLNVDFADLCRAISDAVCNRGGNHDWILRMENLDLWHAKDSDPYWECSICGRIHLHESGGLCTNCYTKTLVRSGQNESVFDLRQWHYYAGKTASGRKAIRLHCEELTGQTDDQAKRQRHFRNIILTNGIDQGLEPRVAIIDLLSVTTTMEVGVDIGDLRVVMQANMPPERFNYQQRAGRGGRRGQAFSAVLTLCRQRSHDTLHFLDPAAITGDKPPVPFLAMNLDAIDIPRRLLAKEVLRQAFFGIGVRWYNSPTTPPDSHGEMGYASDKQENVGTDQNSQWIQIQGWGSNRKAEIQEWINQSTAIIEQVITALTGMHPDKEKFKNDLVAYATSLPQKIDDCLTGMVGHGYEGVAHNLAEGAVLPMFGMPSRVRELYHGIKPFSDAGGRPGLFTMDRDLDMAVSEFAPGSQKTKDKHVHQSIGIVPSLVTVRQGNDWQAQAQSDPFRMNAWMFRCETCHWLDVKNTQVDLPKTCPQCGSPSVPINVREPVAFRTDFSEGEDALEDVDIVLPPGSKIADTDVSDAVAVEALNTKLVFKPGGRIYGINDNNRNLFEGAMFNGEHKRVSGGQWLEKSRHPNQNGAGAQWDKIALIAPKTTDVLVFRPLDWPSSIDLNPLSMGGGVKAAFISAAFMLRSIAADLLDIDPEEMDICGLRSVLSNPVANGGTRRTGEIVMSDFLPNGAGFVRWLGNPENMKACLATLDSKNTEYVQTLLGNEHVGKCRTACQKCLKNYRNMIYHGLFDWRLGLALVRLMQDRSYQSGSDGEFPNTNPALAGWLDEAKLQRDRFCTNFNGAKTQTYGQLPGFTIGNFSVIIKHSLWSAASAGPIMTDAMVAAGDVNNIRVVDLFNLQRRPSWVYQNLVNFTLQQWDQGVLPAGIVQSLRLTSIPGGQDFTLTTRPRGFPPKKWPTNGGNFTRNTDLAQHQVVNYYLIKQQDEYIAGRISKLESEKWTFMPGDYGDGLAGFAVDAGNIVARYNPT